jgi:hypothetical protein
VVQWVTNLYLTNPFECFHLLSKTMALSAVAFLSSNKDLVQSPILSSQDVLNLECGPSYLAGAGAGVSVILKCKICGLELKPAGLLKIF